MKHRPKIFKVVPFLNLYIIVHPCSDLRNCGFDENTLTKPEAEAEARHLLLVGCTNLSGKIIYGDVSLFRCITRHRGCWEVALVSLSLKQLDGHCHVARVSPISRALHIVAACHLTAKEFDLSDQRRAEPQVVQRCSHLMVPLHIQQWFQTNLHEN